MSTFISCADEFHTLLKDSKRSKAHCLMRLNAPPFVSDRNTQDYKLRHGSVSLCILLYGSPSSHKEDTVAQEITTQTFPQETAALPGCSPTDSRWGVWHEFVVKKLPYQNWVLLFYSSCSSKHWVLMIFELETNQQHLVQIAVLPDYWKLGRFPAAKPAPQHCDSLGWRGMRAKPIPWICLRTLENIEKNKRFDLLRLKQKNTSRKTRIRMLRRSVGAILAKKYHHRVSSPLLRMLLHPSVEPKHTIGWIPLTNATRNIEHFIDIEIYRNVKKISTSKNWYKATRLCKKKGILTPCGVSSVEGMLMDPGMLPLVRSFRKSTRTHWWASSNLCTSPKEEPWDNNWTTELSRGNNRPYIFCIFGRNFCLHLPSHSVPVIQHPGSASQFREALHCSQSSHLVYFEPLRESER